MTLSPTEALDGRRLFFIGGTGFLGKVALSMLLHRFPNLGRVYLAVRASAARESEVRFWKSIVPAPPFDPLRERYGAAFEDFLREKVRVVGADVTQPNLGLPEDQARSVASDVDVVINSAGRVTFNPALDAALRTNVLGVRNVIAFTKRMRRPALVHTSTCFVAGNRSGTVRESEPVIGYFPRRAELPGVEFSAEREIADCERLVARVREEAQDAVAAARFVERVRQRLADEGRDPDDEAALAREVARERKAWLQARLTAVGAERAAWWGWPNTYTYTKSLGEQLVAAETDVVRAIVRPSIIESASAYPFPGWNEGFTTTAPIILVALNGQTQIPANERLLLDVTPVDAVAAVVLAVTAEACVREPQLVYQAATGDSSPLPMRRVVELTGLYKRARPRTAGSRFQLVDDLRARMEPRPVSVEHFERASIPMINAAARKMSSLLDRVQPGWGGGQLADVIGRVKERVDRVEQVTRDAVGLFAMFRPFTVDNEYEFRADNVRALVGDIRPEERALLPWQPERLDWYDYWLRVHVPGLERWIFPALEEELRGRRKEERAYTYRDLLELFEAATKRHARRVAMRIERSGEQEWYTYADLQEAATRAASLLAAAGVGRGDRILLVSHNAPEWAMCYFGVLKAGATCVPIDPEALTAEIAALARASGAAGVIVSRRVAEAHPDLGSALREAAGDGVQLWRIDDLLALDDLDAERQRIALLPDRVPPHTVASLIFTSGTTGRPKGVMLSHRNLASMVSMLSSAFDLSSRDGTVSVLPLHHTFELSAGLLTPLSRGAQITYLPEVSRDEVLRAMEQGRVTAIVGVPALWESVHRRIASRLRERGPWVERAAQALIAANRWLRDRTPLNAGPLLFRPIHAGLGGRLRYLISGGAALSPTVKRDLHGLGFTVLEGYGLTEASPVLTVARPGDRFVAGGVGRALPGVDIRIVNPDASGVGEVVARGANVMVGYYGDEEATHGALRDHWLHTGDLGRVGDDGTLYLVGRSKDVIIDGSGRNVYPEDVEALYGGSPLIKELCVVGLRDGPGEQLACVVVPDYAYDLSAPRDAVRRAIETHFRDVSARLPYYRRVKVLHFADEPLPRTATRKVRRREVAAAVAATEEAGHARARSAAAPGTAVDDQAWLLEVVATVSNRPRESLSLESRLADLGFDSLMFVELAAAIDEATGASPAPEALFGARDVRELARIVGRHGTARRGEPPRPGGAAEPAGQQPRDGEIRVPRLVRAVGNAGLDMLQHVLYEAVLRPRYEGRENIPAHTNFIVAANHASHLDMGLVKMALGDHGRDLVALAAADYFFDSRYKRAYVENFTNLIPIERGGDFRRALRHARAFLEQGYVVLIFPEGTRSQTGEVAEFKPAVGYLALAARVGILPVYLHGTRDALPKGAAVLRARDVGARIGRLLSIEQLETSTRGLPSSAAHRLVAALARHEVLNLRDGTARPFDAASAGRADVAGQAASRGAESSAPAGDTPASDTPAGDTPAAGEPVAAGD